MSINEDYRLVDFISEDEIKSKVRELGSIIAKDYENKSLLMVCVLKGGVIFLTDLIREIPYSVDLSFISVSSYLDRLSSTGNVRLLCDLDRPLKGLDVLIVEDIIDSGNTLKYLYDVFLMREPASLKICTLLDKPARRQANIKADYVGFEIADEFVVGYGLDYASKHRNLPNISIVNFNN